MRTWQSRTAAESLRCGAEAFPDSANIFPNIAKTLPSNACNSPTYPLNLPSMAARLRTKSRGSSAKSRGARLAREQRYGTPDRGNRKAPAPGAPTDVHLVDAAQVNAISERWLPHLDSIAEVATHAALDASLGEALRLGLLYQAYWEPTPRRDGPDVPGFCRFVDASILHARSGYELIELALAAAKADADANRASETLGRSPMLRAEVVLREIKTSLEFLFDDAEFTREDEQLDKLKKTYPRPRNHAEMAAALDAYSLLGHDHRVELGKLPGFDVAVLDEALALGLALRERSGVAKVQKHLSGVRDLHATRNQLLTLLQDRMGRIRRAARLLFREYPDVARRFVSEQGRGRGAKASRERSG